MNHLTWVRGTIREHPAVTDASLAAFVFVAAVVIQPLGDAGAVGDRVTGLGLLRFPDSAYAVLICGALAVRRRRPGMVLAVTSVGMAVFIVLGGYRSALLLAPTIAAYTLATEGPRRSAVWTTVLAAAGIGAAGQLFGESCWQGQAAGVPLMWMGLGAAIGDAVRSGRAFVGAIQDRADRAERTREAEAARRVMEERLRIARELHDVLAHHIALIHVQAGVVAQVLDTAPEQARESAGHIRRASRAALAEMRTTVGLLRREDVPVSMEPAPGLDRLPALLAEVEAAGVPVVRRDTGRRRELPAAVELTAYRVVQEALTNVGKHARGASAVVRIGYERDAVRVEVGNTRAGPSGSVGAPGAGSGHGLIGMRERALALGGTFTAGPCAAGGYRVRVVLPTPAPDPVVSGASRECSAVGGVG
ncbi:sensor histidine kinase [Embleya hyalina]|uniref:histidine kinase n=1 Tax=Embleya hyalina TaxID=516124 RepID=A0A401YN14_9ACTN|nr:sensor histidine kinase [Embleya hyalina]GCD95995.1 two-component sensor histidine kinase [Embleya hyalina]